MKKRLLVHLLIGACLIAGNVLFASSQEVEFFETKIRPLLSEQCFACHGPKLRMGGLDLSTAAGVLKGGNSGPVVVKGDPENSRLIQAVSYLGKITMPPSGKLSEQQIADLTAWVKMRSAGVAGSMLPGFSRREPRQRSSR